MAKLEFVEPEAAGAVPIDVYVTNTDGVHVTLAPAGELGDVMVSLSYWQLERICRRVRQEFSYQLNREESERDAIPL